MRIAHIVSTFPPYQGGAGNACYYQARELVRRGCAVSVFTARWAEAPEHETWDGIEVHRMKPAYRFGNAPLLPRLLSLNGFDLLHLHFPFYLGAELAGFSAWRTRTPLVVTYHQDMLRGGWVGTVARLHDRTLGAAVLKMAQRVCFTTLDYARLSRMSWLLRLPNHAVELPNGVDTEHFQPGIDASPIRQRLGIPAGASVILMVAGLDRAHYFKGVPVLLRALSLLGDADTHLVLVGEGDLRPSFIALAASLGLQSKTHFVGRVSLEELPAYYALSDLVVLPSVTMGEAFGLVLLEAMACARPVVASRLPGVRVVVTDGEDGLLAEPGDPVDLADKLQRLLSDASLRRRMGLNGREKVLRQYTWSAVGARLEALYQQVLEERR